MDRIKKHAVLMMLPGAALIFVLIGCFLNALYHVLTTNNEFIIVVIALIILVSVVSLFVKGLNAFLND